MDGKQRICRQHIASTQTLAKVFRTMEMIAASRVSRARRATTTLGPYEEALMQAVAAVAIYTNLDRPLTRERFDAPRVAVLVIASDHGMAGIYSATILHESERLTPKLRSEGKVPVVYTFDRRARPYLRFHGVAVEKSWEDESDTPTHETTRSISNELFGQFMDQGLTFRVSKVHLVYTRFTTVMKQFPEVRQMFPLGVVDTPGGDAERGTERGYHGDPSVTFPKCEFIPSAQAVLGAILPLCVESRIHSVPLQSTVSELASHQRAMCTATDSAEELITKYMRLASSAR